MTTALAILVPAAIVILAFVLAAYTPDVDSMADPTPRLGEAGDHGPHVPADVMRRIDAALPRRQVNARHLHFVEDVKQ